MPSVLLASFLVAAATAAPQASAPAARKSARVPITAPRLRPSHELLPQEAPAAPEADEAGPAPRAMTLAQALATAHDHNRALRAAKQQRSGAEAGRDAALATRFPTLSAGSGLGAPNHAQPGSAQGSVTAAYDLDTHGARAARIALTDAQARLGDLGVRASSQATRYETIAAYYDLQGAQEQRRIAELNLRGARESVRDARAVFDAGDGTIFDVQRAEVQRGAAEQAVADAAGQLQVARRRLARVLGIEPTSPLHAGDALAPAPAWPLTLEQSVAQALTRRPELTQRELERESALAQRQLALSARGVQTQVFTSGSGASTVLGPAGWASPPLPNYTAGANLSLLLVDWGANGEAARQAEFSAQAAATRREDAVLQIRLEVEQAYAGMRAAQRNIASAERALRTATAGLGSARERFRGGVGTQTDVLLALNDLVQAENNRIRAILSYNKAIAQLEQVSAAQGLPEPGEGR